MAAHRGWCAILRQLRRMCADARSEVRTVDPAADLLKKQRKSAREGGSNRADAPHKKAAKAAPATKTKAAAPARPQRAHAEGVLPLATRDVFAQATDPSRNRETLLRVGVFEIYNEVVRDLLAPSRDAGPYARAAAGLAVVEDPVRDAPRASLRGASAAERAPPQSRE